MEKQDRNKECGGVCVYLKNDIAYNRQDDLSDQGLEFLSLDILLPLTKPIVLGVFHTGQDYTYYTKLEDMFLNPPSYTQQETYILGDFNTDFLAKKELFDFCP